MQPIIIVTGPPHSYTSMTSAFLQENGGFTPDNWGDPTDKLDYQRFESEHLEDYKNLKKQFKDADLSDFMNGLPTDKTIILKSPGAAPFINEIKSFTDREVKCVYCMRNPIDIVNSSLKKSYKEKGVLYYMNKVAWYYSFMNSYETDTFVLTTERLIQRDQNEAKRLLNFCNLEGSSINYDSIKKSEVVFKPSNYRLYRINNFFLKRFSQLFSRPVKSKSDD